MEYKLSNIDGLDTYRRFKIFELEEGKFANSFIVDFTDQFRCTCNQMYINNNVPRGYQPIPYCPHISFLWDLLSEWNFSRIAGSLNAENKDVYVNDFMNKLQKASELYKASLRDAQNDQVPNEYGWKGRLDSGRRARVIAKGRGRYFVRVEESRSVNSQEYYVQEVRSRYGIGTSLRCSCQERSECLHIEAVFLAREQWVKDGYELQDRRVYNFPDLTASEPAAYQDWKYMSPYIYEDRLSLLPETKKERKKKPPRRQNMFTEFEL